MDLGKKLLAALQGVQRDRGWNETDMATELGVSNAVWANWKARGAVSKDGFEKVLANFPEAFLVYMNPNRILEEKGQDAAPDALTYVDKVCGASLSAGNGEVFWDHEQIDKSHAFRLDWMQKKGLRAERCKVWTVRGDSMDPKYPHGSWVLINMSEREPVHGKNFALIGEDGLRLKQLRRSEAGGWIMYSLNPDQSKYPPEPIVGENYAVIGRVRGHGGDDD
jgi:phage repressor protein C with HTH and peptisase S24 domain